MSKINISVLAAMALFSMTASSTTGLSDLKLWQIKFSADTKFEDGYYIEGTARDFKGRFQFENGILKSVETTVPVKSLTTGLLARDISIREIIFEDNNGLYPDIEFKLTKPVECAPLEGFYYCDALGSLSIRGEFKPLKLGVYIGTYENQTWLHADFDVRLSDYDFYQSGSAALKVADLIQLNVDLLGDE